MPRIDLARADPIAQNRFVRQLDETSVEQRGKTRLLELPCLMALRHQTNKIDECQPAGKISSPDVDFRSGRRASDRQLIGVDDRVRDLVASGGLRGRAADRRGRKEIPDRLAVFL